MTRSVRPVLVLLGLLGSVAVTATGCGGASPSSAGAGATGATSGGRNAAGAPATRTPAGGGGSLGAKVAAAGPDIVETGTLEVRLRAAADVAPDATEVAAVAGRLGGYVQSSTVTSGRLPEAAMTVRVPDDHLAQAVGAIASLGEVTTRRQAGEDVTGQVVDLAAEEKNFQSEEVAVRGILRRATKVSDVLAIQQQLFILEGQIRELAAQRDSLANSVAYASLTVTLGAAAAAPAPGGGTLARFWELATRHTVDVARGVFLAVGWAAPGLLLAVVALVARLAVRRRRRPPPLPEPQG